MNSLMKKISPTALFLIGVLIVMAVFFVTSLAYSDPKVKLMPAITSGFTIVLSLIALVKDLRTGSKGSMPTDDDGDVVEDEQILNTPLIAYFKAFLWFVVLIALVCIVGFIIAIPIWMTAYLWKQGYRWWTSLLLGMGLVVIIYLAFTVLFQVELYPGVVLEMLGI